MTSLRASSCGEEWGLKRWAELTKMVSSWENDWERRDQAETNHG